MKIIQTRHLVNVNGTKDHPDVQQALEQITEAITSMVHPSGSDKFILFNKREGNGVTPIKHSFINRLHQFGWEREKRINVGVSLFTPGPIDAAYTFGEKHFAVEWETGNISSSHRAINKIIVGVLSGKLLGGVLVLPSREMYKLLTDRVGNYRELEPYFSVWEQANYQIAEGYVGIIEVEHDDVSNNVEAITKGTDGRALR